MALSICKVNRTRNLPEKKANKIGDISLSYANYLVNQQELKEK